VKLIVGLGNPGSGYSETRHNAGRMLVERIAARHSAKFIKKSALKAFFASFEWDGEPAAIAYPETFVNASGEAVGRLVAHLKIVPQKDLLIAVDDVALPFGALRLRGKGSSGGHNGLKSIEAVLGTPDYPRLRLGVGLAKDEPVMGPVLKEYVLAPFNSAEKAKIGIFLDQGIEACRLWLTQPITAAMNAVNYSSN
jgi:peptidyl-tRNA hydrolase, PTH1 family